MKILKGKETVATAPARLVQGPTKAAVDSYAITKQQDGSRVLSSSYFGGKHFSLEIGQSSAQTTRSRRVNAVTTNKPLKSMIDSRACTRPRLFLKELRLPRLT